MVWLGYVLGEVLDTVDREYLLRKQDFLDIGYGESIGDMNLTEAVPVTGDQLDTTIVWKAGQDISRFAEQWIALRFHVQNASLYSFWIE